MASRNVGPAQTVAIAAGLLLAQSAPAATSFDGTYRGQATLSRGVAPQCGRDTLPTTISVVNGQFTVVWDRQHNVSISLTVQPDGSFSGARQYQIARHPWPLKASGRITGNVLDGEIEGEFCSRTYHLTRS
jgi:hypothetical protein